MKTEGINKIVAAAIENRTPLKMSSLAHVVKKADEQGLEILATRTIQSESLTMLEGMDDRMFSEIEANLNNLLDRYLKIESAQGIDPRVLDKIREMMPRVRLLVRDNTAELTLVSIKPVKLDEIKSHLVRGDFGLVDQEDERKILLPRNNVYAQQEIREIRTMEGEVLSARMMTEEEEIEFEEVREAFLEIYTQVNTLDQKEEKESARKTSAHVETKVASSQKPPAEVEKKSASHQRSKEVASPDRKKITAKMTAAAEKKREEIRKEAIEKEEFGKELSKKREIKENLQADALSSSGKQEYSHNLGKSHKFNKIARVA